MRETEVEKMFSKEVGIDLGTANLLMYVKGEGIVIDEPSVVAIDAETKRCLAAGQEAKDMLGRTPGRVLAIRPLKDGVIADFEVTEIMLNFFFKKLAIKGMFKRPTILICCQATSPVWKEMPFVMQLIVQVRKKCISRRSRRWLLSVPDWISESQADAWFWISVVVRLMLR